MVVLGGGGRWGRREGEEERDEGKTAPTEIDRRADR